MQIISHNTQTAFIALDLLEEYPEEIVIQVDRKRKFKKHICEHCLKVFYSRNYSKFCSSKCSDKNKSIDFECPICHRNFTRSLSDLNSKHNIYFCSRICKEKAQSVDSKFVELHLPHYKDGKFRYASRAKRLQKWCDICGEANEDFLIVHHIDENRENNSLENLRVLCANCHMRGHRKGVWYI